MGAHPLRGCVSGSSEAHYSAERDAQRLAAEVVGLQRGGEFASVLRKP